MNDFIQGNYEEKFVKKPLPVGISDYRRASTEYYYVDKTMMIKEFIDERPLVSLFTRPRRFGKTLNMDMLRTFFEKTEEDTSIYFKIKRFGSVVSSIAVIRESIRLFFSRLRILNLAPGKILLSRFVN